MANRFAGCPYAERRVRPIYDLLDNGNNKKALQEADKVLKKQPNLSCAKALKCLALLRLGRESESLELLEAIKNESPVEESTLQAVTVCYREVHQPQSICELYERAIAKEPKNEDILNHLFLAYVRVDDYSKQKLTALSLYKIKAKNQYYFWAIISTLLQSVDSVSDLVPLCSIPANRNNVISSFISTDKSKFGVFLVHRLMEKLINEDRIESEQEVLTYILVLEMLEKYEEALGTLTGSLGNKLEPFTVMNKKLDLLIKLGRWEQVHSQVEDMLFEEPDCWHCYLIYLDAVFKLAKDEPLDVNDEQCYYVKAKTFLESLLDAQKGAQFKKRGPYLGRLEFYLALVEKDLPASELFGESLPLLEEYYIEFGSKDSCVHDLRKYLHLAGDLMLEFLIFTYKCIGLEQDTKTPSTKTQLNLLVRNSELERIIGVRSLFCVNEKRKMILSEVNRYISCLSLCTDSVVTDTKSVDRLALIVAHRLFELWTDTEDSNYLFEAIVLCEYALSQSPCNCQLKILLLKFYHLLGGSEGAHVAYIVLDLKHMQLDTLGYLHLSPLIANASYVHATNVLNSSIKFFTNNSKESADHVTFAYKYEAYTKIPEFIGIREKMSNSTHYLLSTVEKMLCEMFTAQNYSNSIQMAKDMEISLNLDRIQWSDLRDNRDFTVLWDIEAPDRRLTEECIVQSHNHSLLLLRLRSLLLHCIVSSLNLGKIEVPSSRNETEKIENSSSFAKAPSKMMEYIIQLEESLKPVKNNIPSPISKRFIAGPPVSRLLLMLQVNYFDLILNELRFIYGLVAGEDNNREKCQYQLDAMVLFVDEYLRYIRSVAGSPQIQLRNTVIQVSALFVELICFSCIIAGVCEVMMSKSKQNLVKKSKKKKENLQRILESPDEFEWRVTLVNKFITFLIEIIKELETLLKSEEKLWSDKNAKICELLIINNVDNREEKNKIRSVCSTVLENLYHSYIANITQMSTVLKLKSKYLSTLKL